MKLSASPISCHFHICWFVAVKTIYCNHPNAIKNITPILQVLHFISGCEQCRPNCIEWILHMIISSVEIVSQKNNSLHTNIKQVQSQCFFPGTDLVRNQWPIPQLRPTGFSLWRTFYASQKMFFVVRVRVRVASIHCTQHWLYSNYIKIMFLLAYYLEQVEM